MPEYRRDPLSGSWVILARERAERPSEFVSQPVHRRLEPCPFCAGNERLTPDPLAIYPPRTAGEDEWQVRVVANKYPALLAAEGTDDREHDGGGKLCEVRPGFGWHEVVVESPQHAVSFADLTSAQAHWAFVAYRDRLRAMAESPPLAYGLLFKNCRGGAGATLEHSHSQVVGMVVIPTSIRVELDAAAEFYGRQGKCIFCHLSERELADGSRMVLSTERFVAFCPFASRFAYEVWVLPRQHAARFDMVKLDELEEISRLFQQILRALEKIFPQVPYNFWIHTVPFDRSTHDYYHWHIEIVPRITTQAGFEWGAGCFMNPAAPEDAADTIRSAMNSGPSTVNH
jgi:UDPglucose--hexose-1-phosphate uridylyltransferase